jgi:hypothetical protein
MSEKDLTKALDATPPGYSFSDRELLNITRVALSRVFTGRKMREAALQALARLEDCTELPGSRDIELARPRQTEVAVIKNGARNDRTAHYTLTLVPADRTAPAMLAVTQNYTGRTEVFDLPAGTGLAVTRTRPEKGK